MLEEMGFDMGKHRTVLELARPVRGVRHLAAVTASHPVVLLVGVFAEPPEPANPRLAMPDGFHPASRRLIHCWKGDAQLPEPLTV
jgi:hypothetical protein